MTAVDDGVLDLEFAPDVEPHHRRIDPDEWDNIYVVGDVHGCLDPFEQLLQTLDVRPDDLVVCVGDLVRKGPDSADVVDLVRNCENVISVRGNNEQKLVDGRKELPTLDEEDLSFLADLPLAISWDDSLVVHGGVHPERALDEQDAETLLTMRSHHGNGYDGPFWFDAHDGPPRVFFGHTVLEEPVAKPSAIGLDTGCVYGGSLTAFDCTTEEFVSVSGTRTHQQRATEKFLNTETQTNHS